MGGRDARSPAQFVWDSTNDATQSVGQTWDFSPVQTCLYFRASGTSSNGRWGTWPCVNRDSMGALCENIP